MCPRCRLLAFEARRAAEVAAERAAESAQLRVLGPPRVGVVAVGWRPAGPTLLERILKALRPFIIVG